MNIYTYSPKPWEVSDTKLELGQHQIVRLVGELGVMVRQLTAKKPDLVFLVGFEPTEPLYIQELEKLCLALPQAPIVALHPQTEPELLLSLMRAGVREVIVDSNAETLQQVIKRVHLRAKGAIISHGRVFGFVSSKGGDGSSCIAANLAVALSQESGIRVLAVDISLPFGDLDMYFTGDTHPRIWLTFPVNPTGLTSRFLTAWCSTSVPHSTSSLHPRHSKKSFISNPSV